MTDNEIIKALELCKQNTVCTECPYISTKAGCQVGLISDALNLINRQKAEIEQWEEEANRYQKLWREAENDIKNAIVEAIRKLAERLKENVTYHEDECGEFVPWVDCRVIDNLVKEKTEVDNV